ncbi:MAG: hypothetical protein J3R72DRAFT_449243 [Linnemannia gamsii]|nr:MAG: hypothetical protein J3R72DRAFT_449243 [Linnemannia gamsii]
MFKDWGVGCASLVELGALSIQVQDDLSSQRKIRSMERLAEELLQHSVEKVPLTRMGDWESKNLSANQLAYAANDVFVTYVVAEKIKELQMTRPKQDYVLPLATVHSGGTTVVTVRGSLQERLDRPATLEDIIAPVPKQVPTILRATTVGGSAGAKRSPAATRYTKTSKTKVAGSSQATKRRTSNAAAPVASSTGMSGRSSKAPVKATTKKPAAVFSQTTTISPVSAKRTYEAWPKSLRTRTGKDGSEFSPTPVESNNSNTRVDPYFFYGNITRGDNSRSSSSSSSSSNGSSSIGANDIIRTIRTGSKSTVTIIPRRFQKRSISFFPSCCSRQFSSSASATADNKRPGPSDLSDRKQQEGENGSGGERGGNVFFPGRLLPESLEGKDILERNQSVWLEAGGRDLSEDSDVGVGAEAEEQDDWHLRQNQALFASLVTPNSDSDSGFGSDAVSDLGKGMGLKDLESALDKDVLSSLLRRKS